MKYTHEREQINENASIKSEKFESIMGFYHKWNEPKQVCDKVTIAPYVGYVYKNTPGKQ